MSTPAAQLPLTGPQGNSVSQYPGGPPESPGSSVATSRPPQSDLNEFVKQLIGQARAPARLDTSERQRESAATEAQITREGDALEAAQKELASRQKTRADSEMAALKPLFDEQSKALKEASDKVQAAQAHLPEYKPQPVVDPEQYQQFMFGLLGVAMIGGLAGRAGWMRVTQSMNGAMRGLIDGSKERAKESYEQFKHDYDQAMGKLQAAQQNWRDMLYATDVPINQILRQAEIQAKIEGAEEKFLMAQSGHIDRLRQHQVALDRMVDQLNIQNQRMDTQMDTSLIRLDKPQGGGGGMNLDPFGKWALTQIAAGGNASPLVAATSRWASPQRAEIWNELGKEWYEKGIDPRSFNQGQAAQQVERAAQRWAKVRYEAVGRLEGALKDLESPLLKGIATVNGLSPQLVNAPINSAISSLGTGQGAKDLQYLKTLAVAAGRAYQEVTTMPASSAQMHWGAQEMAQDMINSNFSLAKAEGFYKAVLLEIQINRKNLNDMVRQSQSDLESTGMTVAPPQGAEPRARRTPQEMEALYGGPGR